MDNAKTFVERYLVAWNSNQPEDIAAAFTEDIVYKGYPTDPNPAVGLEQLVKKWQSWADEPGSWSFEYGVFVQDERAAVIRAVITYSDGPKAGVYDNVWLLRFAPDGRVAEFTDYWVQRPEPKTN
jgi:ketosteroid isomerase-like protein